MTPQVPHDRNNRFGVVDDADDTVSEVYDGILNFPDYSGEQMDQNTRAELKDYIDDREAGPDWNGAYQSRWDRENPETLRKVGDWDRRSLRDGWDLSKKKTGGPFNIMFSGAFSHNQAGLGPVTP